jgi:hypothetical protein
MSFNDNRHIFRYNSLSSTQLDTKECLFNSQNLSQKCFLSKKSKNKVFDFFEVRNKISTNPSDNIFVLTSQVDAEKNLGRKNLFSKKKFPQSQKSSILVGNFFFQKKSTKESKLVFPTNLTILYPNLQKKF